MKKRRKTPSPGLNHEAVVENWQQNAEHHDEENYRFLRSLKFRNYGFNPDELAADLHQQAFQILDCTRCANCCQSLTIMFNGEDIQRIAGHLNMTVDEFMAEYLEFDGENGNEEDGLYKARRQPCPFLGDDNRCAIYDVRPAVCREYPHTVLDRGTDEARCVELK